MYLIYVLIIEYTYTQSQLPKTNFVIQQGPNRAQKHEKFLRNAII